MQTGGDVVMRSRGYRAVIEGVDRFEGNDQGDYESSKPRLHALANKALGGRQLKRCYVLWRDTMHGGETHAKNSRTRFAKLMANTMNYQITRKGKNSLHFCHISKKSVKNDENTKIFPSLERFFSHKKTHPLLNFCKQNCKAT